MNTLQNKKTNDFNEIVNGRRSIKQYDPDVKISREEMTEILEQRPRRLLPSICSLGVLSLSTAQKEKKSLRRWHLSTWKK